MASWILVPCLDRLRDEFNEIAPGRDKASDGSIGDQAHADRSSSHNPDETGAVPVRDADRTNEVHAIDVDVDLRTPGLTMEKVVQHLVARHRADLEDRLRNIIYNRRIWAASSGWKQQAYTGDNPHDKHAHFEASYASSAEADTHSWHLEDIPVALTEADKKFIKDTVVAAVDARLDLLTAPEKASGDGERENPIGRAALTQPIPNAFRGERSAAYVVIDDTAKAAKATGAELAEVRTELADVAANVTELLAKHPAS